MSIERRSMFAAMGLGLAAMALGGVVAVPALAQTTPPPRIRGTISAIDGSMLTVTSRGGDATKVSLRGDTAVTVIAPAQIGDIKPGSYIGTAAMPQPDGSLKAMEIQVFPESMRGVGEGNRPYDLQPQSTMTNGTVGDVVGTSGRTLTLKYKGGVKQVAVPANAPIITYEKGDRSLLVPGAHVIVTTAQAQDGTLTADRVAVGKNGLTPPM
jgi:hypothetical protein